MTPWARPLAEKTPWTISQETPTYTPSQATPPKRQGALAPSPVYSPPVFCLTSTEILNVLYTPGPVCHQARGESIKAGNCSALGSWGQEAPAGQWGPLSERSAGWGVGLCARLRSATGLPAATQLPCFSCPRSHVPPGILWCFLSSQMAHHFFLLKSPLAPVPRFEIQLPVQVFSAGSPAAGHFYLGLSPVSSWGLPA